MTDPLAAMKDGERPVKGKARRKMTETVLGVAASIENIADMADGTAEDAAMRLRVIKADAERIQRLALMLLGKPALPPASAEESR